MGVGLSGVPGSGGRLSRLRVAGHDRALDATLVELLPETGCSHQLRVHLLAIGHPIVGDALYAGAAAERLLLHAEELVFAHPESAQTMRFCCPAPF